jgi:hypothetical protein
MCANLSRYRPLLLAVDDLPWVDRASLRFLAYLQRRVAELPVLLLVTARAGEETDELVGQLVAGPDVVARTLAPLGASAVGESPGRGGRA